MKGEKWRILKMATFVDDCYEYTDQTLFFLLRYAMFGDVSVPVFFPQHTAPVVG